MGMYRDFVLWIGHIRRLSTPPYVTWDHHEPEITHDEIDRRIIPLLQPGDVGLRLSKGFLSNLLIPGEYKHVWLHMDSGPYPTIVEATGDGVLQKSARNPLRADRLLILRPKLPQAAKLEAVERAKTILNLPYDVWFDFDLAEAFTHLDQYHHAFSCIEVIAYCYYPYFDQLGFKWRNRLGKKVLFPDTIINDNWEIVYSGPNSV